MAFEILFSEVVSLMKKSKIISGNILPVYFKQYMVKLFILFNFLCILQGKISFS